MDNAHLHSESKRDCLIANNVLIFADDRQKLPKGETSMSSISNINNSLLESILLNNQQSNSNQTLNAQTSNIQTTNAQAQTSGSNVTDTVSISSNIILMAKEAILNAENNFFAGSDNSTSNILGESQGSDNSSGTMYDLFLSEENAQMMQANPTLVKNIISAEQAQTTDSASASSSSSTQSQTSFLQSIENINLLSMNPDTLMAIQKYTESANSETQTTSGSQVNKAV